MAVGLTKNTPARPRNTSRRGRVRSVLYVLGAAGLSPARPRNTSRRGRVRSVLLTSALYARNANAMPLSLQSRSRHELMTIVITLTPRAPRG